MKAYIRIKAAGGRRDILQREPHEIPDHLQKAGDLVSFLVRENVRVYNTKAIDAPFFPVLTEQEFEDGVYTGRVAFKDRRNENMQDEELAVKNALQCFTDGIFRLLFNETEVAGPEEEISLKEGDTITFIRLVMLAGRRW